MSHFDALDFSECRFEEVISIFWRSVYFDPSIGNMHVHVHVEDVTYLLASWYVLG